MLRTTCIALGETSLTAPVLTGNLHGIGRDLYPIPSKRQKLKYFSPAPFEGVQLTRATCETAHEHRYV